MDIEMDIEKVLGGQEIFGSFPPDVLREISRFTSSRALAEGEVVHELGGKPTHVFVLVDGRVELRLPGGAGDAGILIRRVARGELFGISPLLGSDRCTTQGVCVEAATVLFIEAQPLIALLRANPRLDQFILRIVARSYFGRYQMLAELVQRFLSDPALR